MDPKTKKVLIGAVIIIAILVVLFVSDAFRMIKVAAPSQILSSSEAQSISSANHYSNSRNEIAASNSEVQGTSSSSTISVIPNNTAASSSVEWSLTGETMTLQIASTPAQEELGLGGISSLASLSGMFFVFDAPNTYGFWMKGMEFPLDIIWLDQDFKIIHIENGLSPSTYPKIFYPGAPAMYVIEVNAGIAERFSLQIGQMMEIHR